MMADDHCLKSDSGHEDSGDDHNGDEIAENEQSQGSVRVVSGSGFRYVIPFPWRLHQMLEEIEQAGDASVVSWLPNGHHFQVHIPQQFVDKVIPKFFKQKSYKSFQRQLHLYGFQRETDGPNRGAYFHESFIQHNRQLALEISRIKAPKRRKPPSSSSSSNKVAVSTVTTDTRGKAVAPVLTPIDRFVPLDPKDLPRGPIRSIKPVISTPKPGFDPVMTFRQQRQACPHNCSGQGPHPCSHSKQPAVPESPISAASPGRIESDATVSETYDWLIKAGVPCTAFDPTPVGNPHDLFECSEDITSLFLDSPDNVTSRPNLSTVDTALVSPVGSSPVYGFNDVDATLDIPQEMLGDINSAIWGLSVDSPSILM